MQVTITFTGLGTDMGPTFSLLSNSGVVTPNTATKAELLAGKTVVVDNIATTITVVSIGPCTNSIILTIDGGVITPTPTQTITPTIGTVTPTPTKTITPTLSDGYWTYGFSGYNCSNCDFANSGSFTNQFELVVGKFYYSNYTNQKIQITSLITYGNPTYYDNILMVSGVDTCGEVVCPSTPTPTITPTFTLTPTINTLVPLTFTESIISNIRTFTELGGATYGPNPQNITYRFTITAWNVGGSGRTIDIGTGQSIAGLNTTVDWSGTPLGQSPSSTWISYDFNGEQVGDSCTLRVEIIYAQFDGLPSPPYLDLFFNGITSGSPTPTPTITITPTRTVTPTPTKTITPTIGTVTPTPTKTVTPTIAGDTTPPSIPQNIRFEEGAI